MTEQGGPVEPMSRLARLQRNGIKNLLDTLVGSLDIKTLPARDVLVTLLTFGGRLPLSLALDGLTTRERAAILYILAQPDARLSGQPGGTSTVYSVAYDRMGRVRLHHVSRSEDVPEFEEFRIGDLEIPSDVEEAIMEEVARERALEDLYHAGLLAELTQAEAEGRLSEILRSVRDWVSHVEAVHFYVDGETFAHSETLRNLVGRPGALLEGLEDQPVASWPRALQLLVFGIWCLCLSGRSIRLEEFCCRQLTATELHKWLLQKAAEYMQAEAIEIHPTFCRTGFEAMARLVNELRQRCDTGKTTRFRRMNGLTYVKQERLAPQNFQCEFNRDLPRVISSFMEQELDLANVNSDSQAELRRATWAAIEMDNREEELRDHSSLERLLESIVLSAAIESRSDYAMSSSLRDLSSLKPAPGKEPQTGPLSLTKDAFFCCALPHPELIAILPKEELSTILRRVAARMEYNRWHFIVGNLDPAYIPANRHYFYPPIIPDISVWSDQQHRGHASVGVRYTVRVPGPPVYAPPLQLWGLSYRGFYDIRLVRQEAPPFSRREMAVAMQHCLYVGAVIETLKEAWEKGVMPVISGFRPAWYRDAGWQSLLSMA